MLDVQFKPYKKMRKGHRQTSKYITVFISTLNENTLKQFYNLQSMFISRKRKKNPG